MTIKTSGTLAISEIVTEFGGAAPHSLSEYYAGGANVPAGTQGGNPKKNIPAAGPIAISDFYSAAKAVLFDVFMLGGGGGGGGHSIGGGGGAGGFIEQHNLAVTTSAPFTITVGTGGADSSDGTASTFATLTAPPGKAGGGWAGHGGDAGAPGKAGGGGASQGGTYASCGGGGGITGAGGDQAGAPWNGGRGGAGMAIPAGWGSKTGTRVGGGGGGGVYTAALPNPAGNRGPGTDGGGNAGGDVGRNGSQNGYPATANTGAGGGGSSAGGGGDAAGGKGGSGLVMIKYLGTPRYTGGTIEQAGGYTIHIFTASGTLS